MEDIQKILNKIALLKNLKERPGTPEEAAVAASKIQELMTKHNLTIFQVDAATRTVGDAGPQVIESFRHTSRTDPWRAALLSQLARVNYVRSVRWTGEKFALIGHEHNVALVWNLYDYLEKEIDRLSREGWKNHTPQTVYRRGKIDSYFGSYVDWGYFPETQAAWRNDFRMGATHTVAKRLRAERDKLVEEAGGSALMVIAQEEVDKKVDERYPNLRSGRVSGGRSASGWSAGREAGRSINLAKQIGG